MSQSANIHPSALVDPGATIAEDVTVGPWCQVGAQAVLHRGVRLRSHAVVEGRTILREGVEAFPFVALGLPPQDKKFDGSDTVLDVGKNTVIRENVSMQPGSRAGGITKVGSDCLIMAYCHIAHDCSVGDGVVMANASQLAGHVSIGDHAFLGGVTTVHQFVRIGAYAMTGSSTRLSQDVPPFLTAVGNPAVLVGPNTVGLERHGFAEARRREIKRAFVALFRSRSRPQELARLQEQCAEGSDVASLCEFVVASKRGITRARPR